LAFINPIDGHTVVDFAVKLSGIAAAAYSPNTGNLYAIRNSTNDSKQNGVYRIDSDERSNEPTATATRVSDVAGPTALAFGPDNVLYVTTFDSTRGRGTLQKIKGDL
jgi:DNA-binding beta-propeller fold protein YncE